MVVNDEHKLDGYFMIEASHSIKSPPEESHFHALAFYIITKGFLVGELKAIFFEHYKKSSREFVEVLNIVMPHSCMKSILLLQRLFICIHEHEYDRKSREGLGTIGMQDISVGSSKMYRNISQALLL